LLKLAKEDPSLRGVHALSVKRIAMLNSDISQTLNNYAENGVGDPAARQACIDQFAAIVRHHCGQHHLCKNAARCTYLKIKCEHPDWNHDRVAVAAPAASSCPLEGRSMSLSEDGICTLVKENRKRFNDSTIDNIARRGCSNGAENIWSVVTKFSNGKRLNQDATDHYEVSNKIACIRIGDGNVEKAHDEVSVKLGLSVSSLETKHHIARQLKMNKKKAYNKTPKAMGRQLVAKMSCFHKMGLVDAKTSHQNGKVPLHEDAK
jgi:hypothetical protein